VVEEEGGQSRKESARMLKNRGREASSGKFLPVQGGNISLGKRRERVGNGKDQLVGRGLKRPERHPTSSGG